MTSVALQLPLDRGERQLWAGCPRQGIVFRSTDVFMIPFSILWGGFAIVWEGSVLRSSAPSAFALFGAPFVLMALYITVGRFFWDAQRRRRTVYAVTSERVIIAGGQRSPTIKSLALSTLSDVTMTERPDGSGTISFGPTPVAIGRYAGTAWSGEPRIPSFEMIPNARAVYDMVRQAQQASRTGTS